MIHFFIGLIASTLLISQAWAACEKESADERRANFLFNLDGSNLVHVNIDGKEGCYKETSRLKVVLEKLGDHSIDYEITPTDVDFEEISDSAIYQFLYVEKDADPKNTTLNMMSFICSGEHPIGADALADQLSGLAYADADSETSEQIFILTGKPAERISVSEKQKQKAKVFDKFIDLYEKRTGEDVIENDTSNIYIPNILASGDMITGPNRALYSNFFSSTSSSLNACSKKFLKVMQDLLIDNVSKSNPFPGIEVKKKRLSSKYKLKWSI